MLYSGYPEKGMITYEHVLEAETAESRIQNAVIEIARQKVKELGNPNIRTSKGFGMNGCEIYESYQTRDLTGLFHLTLTLKNTHLRFKTDLVDEGKSLEPYLRVNVYTPTGARLSRGICNELEKGNEIDKGHIKLNYC